MKIALFVSLLMVFGCAPPPTKPQRVGGPVNPGGGNVASSAVDCHGVTADAGGGATGVQVVPADAGPAVFGTTVGNPSSATASLWASCVACNADAGTGREIPAGTEKLFPSTCLPSVCETVASAPYTCERY